MRRWEIEVTERELRAILSAFDYARENGPLWWVRTHYVDDLYERLRNHGLVKS